MSAIRRLCSSEASFQAALVALLETADTVETNVLETVQRIVHRVRLEGDPALVDFTRQFDRRDIQSAADLAVAPARLEAAFASLPADARNALEQAADRIRQYAERQKLESWSFTDSFGNELGQQIRPMDRVGVYTPGGKAAYPSSVLMNVIPAKVAGVGEVVMCVPAPDDALNEWVLAAAHLAGVDRVVTVGGAQAIAAMAYGTDTVPRVDKIVGPGNAYVAAAKKLVFGAVGIDMIAGPSEIVVVSDGESDPDWVVMDLFSQAEHDQDAQAILISPDRDFLDLVTKTIQQQLPRQPRREIIAESLARRGALIQVASLDEALDLVNRIAPEHLELALSEPEVWLPRVRHAGAVFLGRYTAEAMGDYCAGPNHVLPTSGSARFFSPLGVYDFQKRSSVIRCSPEGGAELGRIAACLARGEGLEAHAQSAALRIVGTSDA
ncbi:MAG: histidinol dehydrogenase [Pseudomonadota bacterium]|nr:histidinol dehydrogenase [Pseudomonadota bacterium]